MTEIVVRLPDSASTFVDEQVAAGEFASASEFLASLVEDARRKAAIQQVDQLLLEGIASGEGEEATPQWWEETRAEWRNARRGADHP